MLDNKRKKNKGDFMKLYLLVGKARSGKDTIAQFIHEYYQEKYSNLKVTDLAIAFYLKEYAKKICNWDGMDETKPRDFLQYLGTDIIRKEIDPLFFIQRMLEDLSIYKRFFDIITISDIRFPIEVTSLKEHYKDAIVISVKRPQAENLLTEEQKKHETEASLDHFDAYDFEILNDQDLPALKKKVIQIIEEVEL